MLLEGGTARSNKVFPMSLDTCGLLGRNPASSTPVLQDNLWVPACLPLTWEVKVSPAERESSWLL